MNRGAAILTLAAVLALGVTSVAIAGKPSGNGGGKSSSSTISLGVMPGSAAAKPTFGSQVTFNVSTTATTQPYVGVSCYQGGTLVYQQWNGMFADFYGSQLFTLGPTELWTGGAASCTANLVSYDSRGRSTTLATTSFDVAA